ncbi:uncharacterized protein ACN427_004806 isoform 1-T1 [Glossina fuscipes fuscipes]
MSIDMIFILMRSLLVIVGVGSFTGQQIGTERSNYAVISTDNKTREIGNGTLTKPYWKQNDDQVAKLITRVKYKTSTSQPTNVAKLTQKITTTMLPEIHSYNSYKQYLPLDLNKKLKFIIEPLSFYKPGVVSDALSEADNEQYTRTHTRNDVKMNKLPNNIDLNNTRSMERPKNRNLNHLNHLNYGKTNSAENATRKELLSTESNDSPLSHIPVYSYSNRIYHQVDQKQTQQFEQPQSYSLDYIDFLHNQRRERSPRSAFYDYFISNYDDNNNMDDDIVNTNDEDNDFEEAQQIRSWSDVFINYKNPHHVNFGHIEHRPRWFERRFQTIKDGNRFKGEVRLQNLIFIVIEPLFTKITQKKNLTFLSFKVIWSNDKNDYAEHYWDLAVGKL